MIKELATFVVQQLVSRPEDVVVTISHKDDNTVVEIHVAPGDRGRVIGKEGHTIKSLRALIDSILPKGQRATIELFAVQSPS